MNKFLIAVLLGLAVEAPGQTAIFVDGGLSVSACSDYDPARREAGHGTNVAFRTLAAAESNTVPGVTVCIRSGIYREPIRPALSGEAGRPITYIPFQNEPVTITGTNLDPAIDLSHRHFIIIDGLAVTNVRGWMRAEAASNNVIRYCTFARGLAPGARAGLRFLGSHYNRIQTNRLEDAYDVLCFTDCDHNLIEGNTFRRGRHALWNILCGSYNVLRHNSFSNEWQKIGQMTDGDGTPPGTSRRQNASRRNLVDGNTFEFTPGSGKAPFDGIQYGAQQGIIRRNWFYGTTGPALEMTLYGHEARYNTDARVYQNVFYNTRFAGVQICDASTNTFGGHVFKNNIFCGNHFEAGDTRWPWYVRELAGKPIQIMVGRLDGYLFESNDIFADAPDLPYAITYGSRFQGSNPTQHELAWWQTHHPGLFSKNVAIPPAFVNEQGHDFRLQPGSPLLGAGTFLTKVVGTGQGNVLPVADATYFYDGYEIPGEAGDLIQLEGQTNRPQILHIDESANTITLDRLISWVDGEGIALPFAGARPDIGGDP